MTTNWWSVQGDEGVAGPAAPDPISDPPSRVAAPPPAPPTTENESERDKGAGGGSRNKVVKVVGAVAGVVITGLLVLPHISGGSGGTDRPTAAASTNQDSGDLPAAGGGPAGTVTPTAKGQPQAQQGDAPSAAPKAVTMTTSSSGKGRVGAVVKVTIRNGTDEPLTVLASMMKGDNRPAVVGEGTLAPGSRTIQPGETATGTVEFSSSVAPHQVALLDLSGNVVAASS